MNSLFISLWTLIACSVGGTCILYSMIVHNKEQEVTTKRDNKIKKIFENIEIGNSLIDVTNIFYNYDRTMTPNLVSETELNNGVRSKVYSWDLGYNYKLSSSISIGHTYSVGNGTSSGRIGTTSDYIERASIIMVFENDKLVSKEEKGLYSVD